ncbi:MAG: HlyD family type I secretion periplasmic adaptor subunit [Aquabacterium sp.]|uniref:HlyD family type I secretion periplasmic adaptor subunit n=1 Tax=Aquabacterium sp. TaxID=1872578 RepID=UPI003BD1CDD3
MNKLFFSNLFGRKRSAVRDDSQRPHLLLWITLLCLIIFVVWASQAEIDQVTRAPGQVIASSRTQIIQSSDGGVVEAVLVKEGDQVTKGQTLVKLDTTKTEAAYLETRAKATALRAAKARLNAEIFGGEPKFPDEVAEYPQFKENQLLLLAKRRQAIGSEISALQGILALAKRELQMNQPLLATGDISMAEVLKIQRQVADLESQIVNKRNKYTQDTQAELGKVEEDLAGVEQTLAQRKDQLTRTHLVSPVSGVVKNIRINTVGGVVKASEEVMQIVPLEDDLVVEAKVRPADIAFLKPGLDANVKIDAYDYTIYGSLNGKLTYISADTLTEDLKQNEQAYYRVQVRTTGKKFSGRASAHMEIQPGMTATVEIKTGSNTVLRYLMKPLVKTLNESLGER